ncbi:MAG: putative LysR family regulatory protein [Microvirga sp.]|jgi:DNA-binding transcriptional LysR family regulator|nr:putative LysR family regulatory protein [Microvirga sp.]
MKRLRKRIGSLENLTALETAVRLGNFTSAARELGVSQPAISRRICDLEDRLGIALFERHGKRLAVTAAGRSLQSRLARAFLDIEEGIEASVRAAQPKGVILRFTPSASGWILPALGSLCNAFPDIPVNLVCLDVRADPDQTDYDLQLRFTTSGHKSEHRHLMLEGEVLQVASPAFAHQSRTVVKEAPLFQMENPFASELDWASWCPQDVGNLNIKMCPTYASTLESALSGGGVALGWRYSVGPHIDAGRLVQYSTTTKRSDFGEYLFVSPERADDPSVQKVINWLHAYAERLRTRYRHLET